MFIPMFPWPVFRSNLLHTGSITPEQLEAMKKECYTMRKEDPIGRSRSNNASGWQSNDGVNQRPIFQSMLNGVEEMFQYEVFPYFLGEYANEYHLEHGNYWVNINYQNSYNNAHTHPGCWYSGVIYIQIPENSRKDGALQFLSGQARHMSDVTHMSQRDADNFPIMPEEGDVLLFPSAMIHFVEPHSTDYERISIAFNNSFKHPDGGMNQSLHTRPSFNPVEEYAVCPNTGNLIYPK